MQLKKMEPFHKQEGKEQKKERLRSLVRITAWEP